MSAKIKPNLRYLVEYFFLRVILFFVNIVPFRSCRSLARALVFLLSPILNSTRKRIADNLNHAFPEKLPEEIKSLIETNLVHTITIFLETGQGRRLANRDFVEKTIIPAEPAKMQELLKAGSLVIVEGHLGNWELPPSLVTWHGIQLDVSAAHIQNPYVDDLTARLRANYGCGVIYLEESKKLIRNLKKGKAIGLVADQDAGQNGVFVPFLGRKASTYTGPALLAWLTESRLEFFSCIRQSSGTYRLKTFTVEEKVSRDKYPDKDLAIKILTTRWVKLLEDEVKAHPEQYFWAHRRWKTRPSEETTPH